MKEKVIPYKVNERAEEIIGTSVVDRTLFRLKGQREVFNKRLPSWEMESIARQRIRKQLR